MPDTAPSTGVFTVVRYEHETDKTDYLRVTFPRTNGRSDGEILVRPSEYGKRSQFVSRLMDLGALEPDKHKWPTFAEIASGSDPGGVPIVTPTIGWKGEHPNRGFLLPGYWAGDPSAEPLLMPGAREDCIASGVAGDLSTWKRKVARPAKWSPYVAIALLTSLAGSLLVYCRIRESFIVNLAGQSSTGKSTGTYVAASVWGDAQNLWVWNSTPRSLAEAAAAHKDLCLIPDDTEPAGDGKTSGLESLQKDIHTLASGKPKRHSKSVSSTDQLPRLTSRCTVLASSPQSVEAYFREKGWKRTDGDRVRLLEMGVPDASEGGVWKYRPEDEKRTTSELSDALYVAATKNHGVAGRAWVDYLVSVHATLEEDVAKYSRDFIQRYAKDASGPKLRIVEKVAFLFAVARIARKAEILPWSTERAREITSFAYQEMLKAGFPDEADTTTFVSAMHARLQTKGVFLKVRDGALNSVDLPADFDGFAHQKTAKVYVRYDAFVDICEQCLPSRAGGQKQIRSLISALQASGVLLPGHGRGSTQDVTIAAGQLKFLVFDLKTIRKIASKS